MPVFGPPFPGLATAASPALGVAAVGTSTLTARQDHVHTGVGQEMVLWTLTSANMNSTADQAFTKSFAFTNYMLTHIRAVNASTSLTLAVGGIYNTASKGGTALVANSQVYSALTGATLGLDLTLVAFGIGLQSGASLFLSLTTGQGGAATADLYAIGVALS
jgi:hypothetical protein